MIIFENGAALAGVFFSSYFQMPVIEGMASILIGIVLGIVGIILIIESRNLLIGESGQLQRSANKRARKTRS